ncbi:MAG: glycosyl transferase family 36, partial [bacterium]
MPSARSTVAPSSSGPESPRLANPYGYFDVAACEYVITNPQTPAPWVNYLTNGRYTALHSHTSGGFSFYRSAKDSRVTRWRYNSLPLDRPGRYLYFRNRKNGEIWSPSWQPTFTPLDRFECRHGMNYSRLNSSYGNIDVRALYFVPRDADCEIWWFTLNNTGKHTVFLDLFAYVELCLGHALVDLINQPNDQHFNEVRYSAADEILLATKRYWVTYNGPTVAQANKEWDTVVWMALGLPVKSFDGSKDQFIGPWRSEEHPLAVDQGHCFNSEITSGDAVAALQSDLEIQPGDTRQFAVLLGAVPKDGALEAARAVARKYRSNANIAVAFDELKKFNQNYLSGFQCIVPDPEMQLMLNFWNQYQTKTTFQFSRDASYYHGGLLFGRGYRDSCQDLLGPLLTQPDWAWTRIKEMAAYQFQSGKTYHCYYPLTGGGEVTGHTDTPLWLPFAACWYFRETGHLDQLKEPIRFVDGGEAPLLDHLLRALDFSLSQLSPRGLALFGPGDWNDTLDYCGRGGKGESVWVSLFQCYVMKELIGLLREIGHERTAHYEAQYQQLKDTINQLAWDGEWYLRGTNDLGEPIGSSKCEEGRIFLNAQSWAIISGVADGDRARRCMDSVKQHLATPKGPKILHPPYTKPNSNIGLATRCVPGKKENGAVF